MSITKAQFNASTLKGIFNPATKKGLIINPVGNTCTYCGIGVPTPRYVEVTISGITVCTSCFIWGEFSFKWTHNWTPSGTWVVPQRSGFPCAWQKIVAVNGVTLDAYNNPDCTDLHSTQDLDVYLFVARPSSGGGIDIFLYVQNVAWPGSGSAGYFGAYNEPEDSGCLNVEGVANVLANCTSPTPVNLGYGGTATLKEWPYE